MSFSPESGATAHWAADSPRHGANGQQPRTQCCPLLRRRCWLRTCGQAVGTAAAGALLARMAGRGAQMGAEGGPAGVLGGAVAGVAVGGAGLALSALTTRGGSGGNSQPFVERAGSISGFRIPGRNVDQAMVAQQQRAHVQSGAPAAFTGSTRTLNGLNEGHQPPDKKPRTLAGAYTQTGGSNSSGYADPIAALTASTAAPQAKDTSGLDQYRALIDQMDKSKHPRERSPRRADRRPLGVQRAEQEAALAPGGDARERAMAQRSKTLPSTRKEETMAVSSSRPPPPPPGAGAARVQTFNIARRPRQATETRVR